MATAGAPVGQLAYQNVVMQRYSAAWAAYVKTSNRYFAGPPGAILAAESGMLGCSPLVPMGPRSKAPRLLPIGGPPIFVVPSAGGSGYAVNDTITMQPVNGGRPIVVKVTGVAAGAVTTVIVLDPGSGLLNAGAGFNQLPITAGLPNVTLTQASTSGGGTAAAFAAGVSNQGAQPQTGWGAFGAQPNPAA